MLDAPGWTRLGVFIGISVVYPLIVLGVMSRNQEERARLHRLISMFPTLWRQRGKKT